MENGAEKGRLRLRVLTPEGTACDREADMVVVRTTNGDLGIMRGHEPYLAALDDGVLRVFEQGRELEDAALMVLGGVVTVRGDCATVLSHMAEHPSRIEAILENIEHQWAAGKLREQTADVDTHRMELALRRALVHSDVSAYSILREHGAGAGDLEKKEQPKE